MVLKELILNSFYFSRVWWSWKNWFWTVSTFGQVWWSWKNWFWTVSILRQCGGLERTDFEQFLLWEGVVVLKELILNSFYFGKVWWSWKKLILNIFYFGKVGWSWKNWIWTVSILGRCGGLERTDFEQFLLWDSVVLLKKLILNSF